MMKAKAKQAPLWGQFKSCSIGISLKSPNHTGEALDAIVSWMNGKFDYCTIDLTDSLERLNIMAEKGISEEEARKEANALGDLWMQENGCRLSNLQMPMSMLRWDHWHSQSNKPRLESLKSVFNELAATNEDFSAAIDQDVDNFYMRRLNLQPSFITQQQRNVSRNYLIEEMAGHSLLYENYMCATIYPGKQQESFKMLRDGVVEGAPTGLRNSYYTRLVVYDPNCSPKTGSSGSGSLNAVKDATSKIVENVKKSAAEKESLLPYRNSAALCLSPI